MPNVIKQIVKDGEYGSQTIRMIVKSNERGPQGEQGAAGEAATIAAGNAYSVPSTSNPQVMNTGTSSAAVFDFYIPKGVKGDTGDTGPAGRDGVDGKDGAIQYTAGSGINISPDNVISTQQAAPVWGSITGTITDQTDLKNALDAKQNTLTAGTNITISGDTISSSYVDTTYTAGNAITIDSGNNNAINADIHPADFFTATDTVSGSGKSITLNGTAELPLKEEQLKGDTTQSGTPTPTTPQAVNTVTGRQVVELDGANLFTGTSLTNGYLKDDGTITVDSGWKISDYIAIKPNTTYSTATTGATGNAPARCYYDSNKNYISGVAHQNKVPFINTSPSNACYMRESVNSSHINDTTIKQHQSYEVNLGKNLFDKNNPNIIVGYIDESHTAITSNENNRIIWIPCNPNTTYTVQKITSTVAKRQIAYTEQTPSVGVQTYGMVDIPINATSGSITTGNTAKYLVVRLWSSAQDASTTLEDMLASVQIELGSTATSYASFFTPIELCEIGDYQDYIYKSGNDWYLHKATNKVTYNGSETWDYFSSTTRVYIDHPDDMVNFSSLAAQSVMKCTHLTVGDTSAAANNNVFNTGNKLYVKATSVATSAAAWQTWLASNNITIYYPLATPTDTKITNAALITQLNALAASKSYDNETYITVSSENLPSLLTVEAYKKSLYGIIAAQSAAKAEIVENTNDIATLTATVNALDIPVITVTDTDPGEGVALEANHFIAVIDNS